MLGADTCDCNSSCLCRSVLKSRMCIVYIYIYVYVYIYIYISTDLRGQHYFYSVNDSGAAFSSSRCGTYLPKQSLSHQSASTHCSSSCVDVIMEDCNTLQHTATHCNTLRHMSWKTPRCQRSCCSVLQCVAVCCSVLQ